MNEHDPAPGEGDRGIPPHGSFTQDIHHSPVGARVPEDVGRGAFCNATMILQTNDEVVIDFLSTLSQPQQVVARVILTPNTFSQVISALRENVKHYEECFGRLVPRESQPPTSLPAGPFSAPVGPAASQPQSQTPAAASQSSGQPGHPPQRAAEQELPPQIEDLYERLKLPDRLLGGTYANVVMIRHMAEEFSFDFIANFYPRPVVVSRIFFPAGRIPSFLDAMSDSLRIFRKKAAGQGPPPPPDGTPVE